jgi:drug/metabolite transporter (DMT)-like permease
MKNADWALVISLGILWGMSFVFVELLLAYLSPFMIVYLRVAIGAFEQCGSVSINHHWPTNKNGRTCLYFECKYRFCDDCSGGRACAA